MSSDKFALEGFKAGYHGTVKVTPLTISATSRTELPPGGLGSQLLSRKSIMVQNLSSYPIWVGGENVGFGPSFGGGSSSTCSGVSVASGVVFELNAGRARVYAFNPEAVGAVIKLFEVS